MILSLSTYLFIQSIYVCVFLAKGLKLNASSDRVMVLPGFILWNLMTQTYLSSATQSPADSVP